MTKTDQTELLPCPFCGADGHERQKNLVRCTNYDCELVSVSMPLKQWNTRQAPKDADEQELPKIIGKALDQYNLDKNPYTFYQTIKPYLYLEPKDADVVNEEFLTPNYRLMAEAIERSANFILWAIGKHKFESNADFVIEQNREALKPYLDTLELMMKV